MTLTYVDPNWTVAQAQEFVCGLIDDFRDSYSQGYFTWNSDTWDCDTQSVANITGATVLAVLNGGNLPAGFVWRDMSNNNVPVTGAQMGAMAASLANFVFLCYQASWQHKTNVNALTDLQSINDYDFVDTLWPDCNTQQ